MQGFLPIQIKSKHDILRSPILGPILGPVHGSSPCFLYYAILYPFHTQLLFCFYYKQWWLSDTGAPEPLGQLPPLPKHCGGSTGSTGCCFFARTSPRNRGGSRIFRTSVKNFLADEALSALGVVSTGRSRLQAGGH